jgi:uncharacterized protein (DUF1778 family)
MSDQTGTEDQELHNMRAVTLKPTTVRFSRDAGDLVQQAADEVGSTMAAFVRESAIMRAILILAAKDGDKFGDLAAEVLRLARSSD